MTCEVCHQPECGGSTDGVRLAPGSHPSRLRAGQHEYRGYGEWAIHPDEASFILHRGYAVVDGVRQAVRFIHNEAYVTQVRVEGTFLIERYETFTDCAFTDGQIVRELEVVESAA